MLVVAINFIMLSVIVLGVIMLRVIAKQSVVLINPHLGPAK
jgi:hypothetical protein